MKFVKYGAAAALFLAAMAVVGACGGDDEAPGGSGAETRSFEHALGTSEIPVEPMRVVALNVIAFEAALLLEPERLVGVGDHSAANEEYASLIESSGATILQAFEVDVEAIAALEPDLILDGYYEGALFSGADADALAQIAPVVAFDFGEPYDGAWKDYYLFFGDALNLRDGAEQVLARYDAEVDALRSSLGGQDAAAGINVSTIRVRDGTNIESFRTETSFSNVILDDIGFGGPEVSDEFSLERLREADADHIFVWSANSEESEVAANLDNPLWDSLEAAKNGRLHRVGGHWFGFGPRAAELVLADLSDVFASATGWPVTIEHKFGSTTIEEEPERVVSLGYSEQDPLLALGIVPVAVRDWFGDHPYAVWPWAQDELGDATPEVLTMTFGELDFEAIAALSPDLIVAVHSGITEEEYGTLAEIAPTLAQPADYPDFGVPWQEQTQLIGRAVGREDRANELIAEVEGMIADAASEHPEFADATIAWASPAEEGQLWAVGPNTPPMRFFPALGLEMPTDLAEVVGESDSAQVSAERITLLDATVLIFHASSDEIRASIENDPLYQQLSVAQRDNVIFFVGDDPVYGALSFSTVLSLPFAVEELIPQIAAGLADD